MRSVRMSRANNHWHTFGHSLDAKLKGKGIQDDTDVHNKVIKPLLDGIYELWQNKDERNRIATTFELTGHGFINEKGEFKCQGRDGRGSCVDPNHVFSPCFFKFDFEQNGDMELDHIKEIDLGTEYIASKAMEVAKANQTFNASYFFQLIFGMSNLRLVHKACHDRSDHHQTIVDAEAITPADLSSDALNIN